MKKYIFLQAIVLAFLFSDAILSQVYNNNYYDSISTSKQSFISDLQKRIRSPHIVIDYDSYKTTIIPNFESRDTTNGNKVVTCVYSGDNYIYTPPFAWGYFSREHTWCHSWMATYDTTTGPEYSDQHHLFPTNQNSANGVRNNHPLGKVAVITSQFLGCKYGKDTNGYSVFEPRDSHKGDAARALLYMSLRYDGVRGSWNFNWLNNNLKSLSEGPEDLNTLLTWAKQDPPDMWEIKRNNYIESVQKNRNPFVDHPEYINYIDFNTLTLKTPVLAIEPSNQLSDVTYTVSDSTVTFKWQKAAAGTQIPAGYFITVYKDSNFVIPVDGYVYPETKDLSKGKAVVYMPYNGEDSLTFTNLTPAANYLFTAYSYNGTNDQINYKTTGAIPQRAAKTTGNANPSVNFDLPSANISEGAGTYKFYVNITSTKDLTAQAQVSVTLSSGDSKYIGGFTSKTLTFSPGGSISQEVIINITDDNVATGTQILTLKLTPLTSNITLGNNSEFILNILDNDGSAGGNETFANFPETSQSYLNGTFKGQDGSIWSYVFCSGNSQARIDGHGPVLKKDATAKVESGIIQGGCGIMLVKYMQSFTSNVDLSVFVNDSLITRLTSNNEVSVIKISDTIKVLVPGSFKFRLQQSSAAAGQVTLGSIFWTGYSPVSVEKYSETPKAFDLKQNYPNPFNPETTINYSIPSAGRVTLSLYNTLGQLVKTLVNEDQTAGSYLVKLNGENFSSGIYFYKLSAGNYTASKKLLLLK